MKVNHYEGDYDCSESCSRDNTHKGEVPADFVCSDCGGQGSACYLAAQERRYCPYEYRSEDDWV